MKYEQKTFTLPTTSKQMTTEQYEIAVGLRCARCEQTECICIQPDSKYVSFFLINGR